MRQSKNNKTAHIKICNKEIRLEKNTHFLIFLLAFMRRVGYCRAELLEPIYQFKDLTVDYRMYHDGCGYSGVK